MDSFFIIIIIQIVNPKSLMIHKSNDKFYCIFSLKNHLRPKYHTYCLFLFIISTYTYSLLIIFQK
jgi:hypothetical protein